MAVCAQEDALRRLGSNSLQRSGETAVREPELLPLTVAMMKLKGANPAAVTAQVATSTRFLHEDLLEFPAPPGDRF